MINHTFVHYGAIFHVGFNGHWKGDLWATIPVNENTTIQLPNSLSVQKDLLLSFNPTLSILPPNLKVGGSLYIKNTAIEQLPNNLKVGDTIWAENSKLQKDTTKPIGVKGNIEW